MDKIHECVETKPENEYTDEDAKKDTNKDVVEGTSDDVEEDADNNAGEADRAEQIEEAGENAGEDVGVDTENGGNNELDRSTVTVTTVPGSADADNLTFESDSFSVYAIVYTVDFHYEVDGKTYEFSIPGGGFVSLERLVEVLGIGVSDARESSDSNQEAEVTENDADEANEKEGEQQETSNVKNQIIKLEEVDVSESAKKFVSDVEKVEFSSPDLVWVGKVNTPDTVGGLKKANDLIIEYSADLTEEQMEKMVVLVEYGIEENKKEVPGIVMGKNNAVYILLYNNELKPEQDVVVYINGMPKKAKVNNVSSDYKLVIVKIDEGDIAQDEYNDVMVSSLAPGKEFDTITQVIKEIELTFCDLNLKKVD